MEPKINFTSMERSELELTKNECEHECTRKDGFIESIELEEGPYTAEQIEGCIKTLQEQSYATCGKRKHSTLAKTMLMMVKELVKYGYTPFLLRRQRINDPASECELQGWEQGADDSDCWIDSYFFAVFGNNNLSALLVPSLHTKYRETLSQLETDDYFNQDVPNETKAIRHMNDALYCINLYLNLLTYRASALPQKGKIKWCIVWNILQYFKLTKTEEEYNLFLAKASLQEATLTIGKGGDPNLLSCFLSEINPLYTSTPFPSEFTSLNTMKNSIQALYNGHSNSDILAIPFYSNRKTDASSRYFPELLNLFTHKLFLEAVVVGQVGHATSFTFCNGNWRYYDNKATPTTAMISRQNFGERLNKLLENTFGFETFVLLIYRTSKIKLGGTRKKSKNIRKNRDATNKKKKSYSKHNSKKRRGYN